MAPAGPEPATPETRAGSGPDGVLLASGLSVAAGIWLIVSPFALAYAPADVLWNPIGCGAAVVGFGLLRALLGRGGSELSAGTALLGVWVFVSAFWLAGTDPAIWNVWIVGVVVFVLGVLSAAATPQRGSSFSRG